MTEQELEAIRPPHVTMGAMKVWYYAKRWFQASIVLLFVAFAASDLVKDGGVLTVVGAVNLGLSFLAWLGVLLLGLMRYSLRALLGAVLFWGVLLGLAVRLPGGWKILPVVGAVLWSLRMLFMVLDHDPEGAAAGRLEWGLPARPQRAEDTEPRA